VTYASLKLDLAADSRVTAKNVLIVVTGCLLDFSSICCSISRYSWKPFVEVYLIGDAPAAVNTTGVKFKVRSVIGDGKRRFK
jgi:hypothetical protein